MACFKQIGLILFARVLYAQVEVDPRQRSATINEFERAWKEPPGGLRCRVSPDPPRLAFTLRQWAGFNALFPVSQFTPNTRVAILTRVTPEGAGAPRYFFQGLGLRRIPPQKGAQAYVSGGVTVGPGKYQVAFLAIDDKGRGCRKEWTWNVPAAKAAGLPPGSVAELGMNRWEGFPEAARPGRRVTVLLHAAPVYRRRYAVRLSGWDRYVLLSTLRTVLEQSSAWSARVIVYDWFGRKILFEDAELSPQSYDRLVDAVEDANYGTVDYKVLKDGPGPVEFLKQLLDRARAEPAVQAVIFAGPEGGLVDKRSLDSETWKADPVPAFYVVFPRHVSGPEDVVSRYVKTVKGRVFSIFFPSDLARAMRGMSESLPK